jgi:hypothetical protein
MFYKIVKTAQKNTLDLWEGFKARNKGGKNPFPSQTMLEKVWLWIPRLQNVCLVVQVRPGSQMLVKQ